MGFTRHRRKPFRAAPQQGHAFHPDLCDRRVLLDVEPHCKKDEVEWINLIDQSLELALLS